MKQILRFSIVLVVLFACHRDKVNFVGPAFIAAPEGFGVTTSLTATPSPVDFSTGGKVTFNAAFTSAVSWTLTIKGQTSGAVHVIQGISAGLTNIVWTGRHDGVFFFMKDETTTATLSFYGTSLTSSVNISITDVYNYTTCPGNVFPRYGDFESTPPANAPKISSPYWLKFNAAGSHQGLAGHNIDGQGKDSLATDRNGNPVPPVQGKNYYYIKGLGTQQVFVDGIQTYTSGFGASPNFKTNALPTNPDDVWINLYLYGTGDPNAQLQLQMDEADFDGATSGYQPAEDDAWRVFVTLNHQGWKLFSIQYSKLAISADPAFGGSGNRIMESNKLRFIEFVLLKATDPNSPVEMYFDYPIITVGGPFVPCK
jgi:hypothetical protein